ncbi:MAG: hypothetical protein ABIW38_04650 [Ferruginibacter sp.]
MKKIIFLIFCLFSLALSARSQTSGAVVTTIPSSFTAEDVVKIIVDVSAVGNLAGKEPLYLWTFTPNNPPPGNGDWTNSNEVRRMTKEATNKWSVTFKPTDYYGVAPSEITRIQFLVKAKDGTGDQKTNDITLNVDPLIYVPVVFRTFPKFVGVNEIITAYLDQNYATDVVTERMLPATVEISLFNGAIQVGTTQSVNLKNEGNKVWSYIFFPPAFFNLSANAVADRLKFKFKGTGRDGGGNIIPAESPLFEKALDDLISK